MLWHHITSQKFRRDLQRTIVIWHRLQLQIDTEKAAFNKQWKERSLLHDHIIGSTTSMVGELKAIIGNELQEIEELELNNGSETLKLEEIENEVK